jgi:uncharacterized protein (TIGR03435 family)
MSGRFVAIILMSGLGAASVLAQTPTFEVATIKRNMSGSTSASNRALPGGRVTITNNTLRNIIRNFHRIQPYQLIGGPDWLSTERWDIVAKAEGDPPPERMIEMVKTLVADRFKLTTHTETRELPIYALVLAKGDKSLGPQLHRSTTDCAAIFAEARARGGAPPRGPDGGPLCGINMDTGRMATSAVTIADLARNLSMVAGRSVVDKTGLPGNFDLELTWAPEVPAGNAAVGTPDAAPLAGDAPSLFTAIQEQLGLKLDPQRGPVEVLVIDSVEKPVED